MIKDTITILLFIMCVIFGATGLEVLGDMFIEWCFL